MKREVEAVKLKQLHEEMEIDRTRKEEEERKRYVYKSLSNVDSL